MRFRACIANVMIIVYVTRIWGTNADVSYNAAWEGLWALAEISFGITVTGTFTLPKFIEAKGTKLRGIVSSLARRFASLTSGESSRILMQSKDTTAPQEVTLDRIIMIGNSESDFASINRDHDIQRYPSYDSTHDPANYPSANATDTPHRV